MKKKLLLLLFTVIITICPGRTARSELILRGKDNLGHNLVYDTDLDITWYDMSYFAPEYKDAVIWVDSLSVKVGSMEFTDWRLPSVIKGEKYDSYTPYNSEIGHLYLIELVKSEVLHPWAFPDKWRDFENLLGGYYWMIRPERGKDMDIEEVGKAPAYNSYYQKLDFVPVSGINRPVANRQFIFYEKNKYLGVAVHPGDIFQK